MTKSCITPRALPRILLNSACASFLIWCAFGPNVVKADEGVAIVTAEIDLAKTALGVNNLTIQDLSIPAIQEDSFSIALQLAGETYPVKLSRESVLSDQAPLMASGDGESVNDQQRLRPAPLYGVLPHSGTDTWAITRGSLLALDRGLYGNVQLSKLDSKGQEVEGSTLRYFVVPVKTLLADRNYTAGLHFVYSQEDISTSSSGPSCSLVTSRGGGHASPLVGCTGTVPPYVEASVTIVADYCYWSRLPGATPLAQRQLAAELIQQSIHDAGLPYHPLGVRLRMRFLYFQTNVDPNCASNSTISDNGTLQNFETFWPTIAYMAPGPMAHAALYTGKPWNTPGTLGLAHPLIGGGAPNTCNSNRFFSVTNFSMLSTNTNPPTARFIRSQHFNPVVSHELAHNWGVPHCTDNGIVTQFCGLMNGTGYSTSDGMPAGLFDSNSADIISCNKNTACLLPVSPPMGTTPLPSGDYFNYPGLLSTFWDYGIGYSLPGNDRVRFSSASTTLSFDVASLVSHRFNIPTATLQDPKQLIIRVVLPKVATSFDSVFNLEVLDKTLLWRNVLRVRPSQLPVSPDAQLQVKVPLDTIDPTNFRVRVSVDLAPGDVVELEEITFSTRPMLETAQIGLAHQVVTGDLNGDGVDELVVSEPDVYMGLGEVHVYSGSFVNPKRVLNGLTGQSFGSQVAVVRDLNADGYPELAVGVPASHRGIHTGTPRIEFYRGQDLTTQNGSALPLPLQITAPTGIGFPGPIVSVQDLNGDNVPDLYVGVPEDFDTQGARTGSVRLYSGSNGALLSTVYGIAAGDRFGCSIDIADGATQLIFGGFAYLVVGTCGAPGSFRYVRLYDARLNSSGAPTLIRTESEAAIANLIPGVSGDSRFGEVVKFSSGNRVGGWSPLVGLPGMRYDSSGQPVSAGSIYHFSTAPLVPGRMLAIGGPTDLGFGSTLGYAGLWEEAANGVTTTSYSMAGAAPSAIRLNLSRNGVQAISQFERPMPLYSAPTIKLALGDLDGDRQSDYVIGAKSGGCSSYIGCSRAAVYLSGGLSAFEPRGVGGFTAGTNLPLGSISQSVLEVRLPFSGITSNGVVSYIVRMAGLGTLQRDYLFIGPSVVKTQSLGSSLIPLFGINNNIVLPEHIIPLAPVSRGAGYPYTTNALQLDYNFQPANTASFTNNGILSGVYYHQIVRISFGGFNLAVYPGNIVKVTY